MISQFSSYQTPLGDIIIQGGNVVDFTTSPTTTTLIGNEEPEQSAKYNPEFNTFAFDLVPNPSGGSGRNIIIQKTQYAGLPHGLFYPLDENTWVSSNIENAQLEYDLQYSLGTPTDHKFRIIDSTFQVVATAPIGTIESQTMIQCSSLSETGGPTQIGGLVKWVYLGSSTGSVSLTYNSVIGNCRFVVEYNNSNVIDVSGSGVTSFSKTSSNKFAKVIIYSLTEDAKWDFNLGCPGGGASPFTPPTGRVTFNATLTAYGLTLTGGSNIPMVCTYEGNPNIKTCSIEFPVGGGVFDMKSYGFTRYYNDVDYKMAIEATPLQCVLLDYNDVIATKDNPPSAFDANLNDPSGIYQSTPYGATQYNDGEPFNVVVALRNIPSLDLVHYFVLNFSSGAFVGYEGPISAPTLPANTTDKKYIPIATYDSSTGVLNKIWEGPILLR